MDSLTSLFLRHYRDVLDFLAVRTGSRDTAQDCAQDTWLRLSQNGPKTEPSNHKAYIFRVAANIATDWHRRRQYEQRAAERYAQSASGNCAPDTFEVAVANELVRRLETALMRLPARSVRIFIQHRHEGKAYKEIAAQMGISVSAVEKHMMRLLLACHQALDA